MAHSAEEAFSPVGWLIGPSMRLGCLGWQPGRLLRVLALPFGISFWGARKVSVIEMKKDPGKGSFECLADEVGFEPTEPFGSTVFKTAALNRSATHPKSAVFLRASTKDSIS